MTALPRYALERDAEDAEAAAQAIDRDREVVEAIYSRLLDYAGQADTSDAINHAQQLVESLRWLSISERAKAPDLDNIYPGRSAPGSY